MKQFFKITKIKINIFFSFLVVSFIWSRIVLDNIIINKLVFENREYYLEKVVPVLFLIFIIIEFYLFAFLTIYLIKKDKKIILSFLELKQFLKISKTKIVITVSLIILSFVWGIMMSTLYGGIINKIGFENIEYYMDYIFPVPFYILFLLKLYLFVCLAVYLVEKRKKTGLNYDLR